MKWNKDLLGFIETIQRSSWLYQKKTMIFLAFPKQNKKLLGFIKRNKDHVGFIEMKQIPSQLYLIGCIHTVFMLGIYQFWWYYISCTCSSCRVLDKLRRYGLSGILSYGLLNTAYYLTTFLVVWWVLYSTNYIFTTSIIM